MNHDSYKYAEGYIEKKSNKVRPCVADFQLNEHIGADITLN